MKKLLILFTFSLFSCSNLKEEEKTLQGLCDTSEKLPQSILDLNFLSAVSSKDKDLITCFLDKGANINAEFSGGAIPSTDPNDPEKPIFPKGATALMYAAYDKQDIALMNFLVTECKADVDHQNGSGFNLLLFTIANGLPVDAVVKYVVETLKAKLDIKRNDETVLDYVNRQIELQNDSDQPDQNTLDYYNSVVTYLKSKNAPETPKDTE